MVVQEFLDSAPGAVLGTMLHAVGAIGMLGGLVGYLAWVGYLRRGQEHPNVLVFAAFLAYLSIVVNLLGGFMRTFESGHPGLTQLGHERWAQLMFAKHLALFAGMAALVTLFERVAPRLLRRHRAGGLGTSPLRDHQLGTMATTVAILVATLLGALAQVAPIGDAAEDDGDPHADGGSARFHNATGTLTSTPLALRSATGAFEVAGGHGIHATLNWQPAQFTLALALIAPDGNRTDAAAEGPGRIVAAVEGPLPGTWRFVVSSDLAVDAQWDLSIQLGGHGTTLVETVAIAPGQFFEINTEMPRGASMRWDWEATGVVYFDVHSHFDGDVQILVEATTDRHNGTFTNSREGGYSLLWANEAEVPVQLSYRVWGDFTVDSYFPPRR